MKIRYLLLLVFILPLFSFCTPEFSGNNFAVEQGEIDPTTTVVSPQEASAAVMSMLEGIDRNTKGKRSRSIKDIWATGSVSTKGGGDSHPLFYVLNFEGDNGFAIAAADRRVPPVICITEKGSLNMGDTLDNPGMVAMLSRIETEIKMLLGEPITCADGSIMEPDEYRQYIPLLRGSNFDPDSCDIHWSLSDIDSSKIKGVDVAARWDQGQPFNMQCTLINGTHALAGCVPVAVGQIMYYHRKNANYNGHYYDWDIMQDIINTSSWANSPSAWPLVQHLLADLGLPENLNASPGTQKTTCNTANAPRTFVNFGYRSGGVMSDYDFDSITTEVDSLFPLIIRGDRIRVVRYVLDIPVDTVTSGHTWIADQTMHTLCHMWVVHKRTHQLVYHTMVYRDFVRCNWGNDGKNHGFFLSGNFNFKEPLHIPTKATSDTIDVPSLDTIFAYNLKMITGIRK